MDGLRVKAECRRLIWTPFGALLRPHPAARFCRFENGLERVTRDPRWTPMVGLSAAPIHSSLARYLEQNSGNLGTSRKLVTLV